MPGENIYYNFYNFRLDVEDQQLLKDGELVQLTPKSCQLLLLLIENAGQLVKREDIYDQLWGDFFVEDANLTQNIYVLRKALGKSPGGESYIKTVAKQGYLLNIQPENIFVENEQPVKASDLNLVEEKKSDSLKPSEPIDRKASPVSASPISEKAISTANKQEKAGDSSASRKSGERRQSIFLMISLLFVGVVLSVVAAYYFRSKTQPPLAAADAADIKSLAVLPFNSIGGAEDKEKLSLGMADAVITRLSNIQSIEVRPTSSIFRYVERPSANPIFSGRELEVDAVLDGTVQLDREQVRVSVQLIRVTDNASLWAEVFNEKTSDIFTIQDSISKKVATALSLKLTPQQEQKLVERGTDNREAYQAYQTGIYFWNNRTKNGIYKAIEYFQQAIEHDPNYAQAYAGLADCYSLLAYNHFADINEMRQKARVTAEKALSLNPSLAEGYSALGISYAAKSENPAKALELSIRAVEIAPYNASVRHRYAMALYWNGRLDDAVAQLRLARNYDPPSLVINQALCNIFIRQRNLSDAIKQCERATELSNNIIANGETSLARAYFYNGRHADALRVLEAQINSSGDYEKRLVKGKLAYFYAKLERKSEAEKLYLELQQGSEKDPRLIADLVLISYGLGEKSKAMFYFKEMLNYLDNYPDLTLSLVYDPLWDEIRKDRQFTPLFPKLHTSTEQ